MQNYGDGITYLIQDCFRQAWMFPVWYKFNVKGLLNSSNSFGDYDNDGDMDIYISGYDYLGEHSSFIYENQEKTYVQILDTMPLFNIVESEHLDFDNDSDLDIFSIGNDLNGNSKLILYENNCSDYNLVPTSPTNLYSEVVANQVSLHWRRSVDVETDSLSLTYNIAIGTSKDSFDIVSPNSNMHNGKKLLTGYGNCLFTNFFTLYDLKPGKYYWRIQAIDNSFQTSAFSKADSFIIKESFVKIESLEFLVDLNAYDVGDYDNDNDLDIIDGNYLHINNGDFQFSTITISDEQILWDGTVRWGDFDNDNDLDLIYAGTTDHVNNRFVFKILKNEGDNNFSKVMEFDGGLFRGVGDWIDIDNDGDLDIVLSGIRNISEEINPYTYLIINAGNGEFE
ncbi:hypothetical protein ACFLT1_09460, partial [Bacteroidota bacterium]